MEAYFIILLQDSFLIHNYKISQNMKDVLSSWIISKLRAKEGFTGMHDTSINTLDSGKYLKKKRDVQVLI